jgi:hypothetical protein
MKLFKPLIIQSSDANAAVAYTVENVQVIKEMLANNPELTELAMDCIRRDYKNTCSKHRHTLNGEQYVVAKDGDWDWVLKA